jgi:hypothetical protein
MMPAITTPTVVATASTTLANTLPQNRGAPRTEIQFSSVHGLGKPAGLAFRSAVVRSPPRKTYSTGPMATAATTSATR